MRIGRAVALVAALTATSAACDRKDYFRQYEYEEEVYLSLDGSATVYVNTSVAALDALRGASLDPSPTAQIDRDAVRALFASPVGRASRRPTLSRREGRRFLHVRVDVDDINQLAAAPPFAWSQYRFSRDGDLYAYHQTVGAGAGKSVNVGWKGDELVAFRIHMPSAIVDHNAGVENYRRGNILVWEQTLSDRLRGEPLVLDANIESQSILSRTLTLFAVTIAMVGVTFGLLIWWISRRRSHSGREAH